MWASIQINGAAARFFVADERKPEITAVLPRMKRAKPLKQDKVRRRSRA